MAGEPTQYDDNKNEGDPSDGQSIMAVSPGR